MDLRVKVGYLGHRKLKKLSRKLGEDGLRYHMMLLEQTRANRPDGYLKGLDHDDIAIDCGYEGDPDLFVNSLVECRLLDVLEDGSYYVHDWLDHNPYATGEEDRSDKARFYKLKAFNKDLHEILKDNGISKLSKSVYKLFNERYEELGKKDFVEFLGSYKETLSKNKDDLNSNTIPNPRSNTNSSSSTRTNTNFDKEYINNSDENFEKNDDEVIDKTQLYKPKEFARIAKMEEPLTEQDYDELVGKHGRKEVDDILAQMENHKQLLEKYTKAYTTAESWINYQREKKNGKTKSSSGNGKVNNYDKFRDQPANF